MNQERLAFALVACAGLWLFFRFYRKYLAPSLSQWLLKQGKVKWAMRIRHGFLSRKPGKPGKSGDCCE